MAFFGGLRRNLKKNPINDAVFDVPPALTGGVILYGRIGSGKSVGMKSLVEKYHDHPSRGYKIFDLWGGDRAEHLFWCLPSKEINYWGKVKRIFKFEDDGPKQYKVNLLFPMCRNLPDKLPWMPPYIHSKIFTIPVKSITQDDVSLAVGILPQTGIFQFREAQEKLTKKDGGISFEYYARDVAATNTTIYKNFILPLSKEGLFQSEDCEYNFDLKAEMKDKEAITVLCLDFLPKEYKLFIMGYILRQMNKLIDEGSISHKNIVMIREAAEFFRATDDSIMPETYKVFRKMIAHFIRMGRRGLHLFLDSQSPCLDENTEIMTYNGMKIINKKIKNMNNYEKIFSYDFKKNKIIILYCKKIFIGQREVYKITLDNRKKIIATENHRFFNKDNQEVFVKDLKNGDIILSLNKSFSPWYNNHYKKNQIKKHKEYKHSEQHKKNIGVGVLKYVNLNKNTIKFKNRYKKIGKKLKGISLIERFGIKKANIIKEKIAKYHIGKHLSQEHKLKVSKANKNNKKLKRSLRKFFKEVGVSNKTRKKLSMSSKKLWKNPIYRMKCSNTQYKPTKYHKSILSARMKKQNPMFNKKSKLKMIKSVAKSWKNNPNYKIQWLKSLHYSKINKKEKIIYKLIKKINSDFKYTGNGKKWITYKDNSRFCPDFINEKDKKIIEFDGIFWHNLRKERDVLRTKAYKYNGYKLLIIKDNELKNISKINKKLIKFNG